MAVYLLQHQGTVGNSGDIFSYSIALDWVGIPNNAEQVAERAETAFLAFYNTSGVQGAFPQETIWRSIRAQRIADLATGEIDQSHLRTLSPARGGTVATGSLPPQVALAVSLLAGTRPSGARYRGRFYLPPLAKTATDNNGRITSTARTAILNGVVAQLQELTSILDDRAPQVWSRTDALTSTVERVEVGGTLDTIRTRRNAILESPAGANL